MCLGSPIGTLTFCEAVALQVIASTASIIEVLLSLEDLHTAYAILCYCTAFP